MQLPDYPPNYVPTVELVHPALQDVHARLLKVAENPTGLLVEYPILPQMLIHNLAFLGFRDLPYAHNVSGGVRVLIDMFHVEVSEFQKETPIADPTKKDWSSVNGPASLEAVDAHFFAGLSVGMIEAGLDEISESDLLSLHLGMQQIRDAKAKSSDFDPYAPEHIRKVVHPDEGKNAPNYPIVANKAQRDWDIFQMATHYKAVARPRQRALRDEFPGGRLPLEVAQAINNYEPEIPKQYATPSRAIKYRELYEVIYKGE